MFMYVSMVFFVVSVSVCRGVDCISVHLQLHVHVYAHALVCEGALMPG